MKRKLRNSVFKQIVFSFTFLSWHAKAVDFSIVADPWCPISCAPGSEAQGLVIEIAELILKPLGYNVKYQSIGWSRAVKDTRAGQFNGIAGALKSDAPDFIFPSQSWMDQKSCFYVKKSSNWKFIETKSLNSLRLGLVRDYFYGKPLDEYLATQAKGSKFLNYVSGVNTTLKLIKLLDSDRIDVLIEDESVMKYQFKNLKEFRLDDYKSVGCLDSAKLYLALSPKNPKSKELVKLLDIGFEKLRQSKSLKDIYRKYGLTPVF